jgi:hypothetical protein
VGIHNRTGFGNEKRSDDKSNPALDEGDREASLKANIFQAPIVHPCNPSYSEGRN